MFNKAKKEIKKLKSIDLTKAESTAMLSEFKMMAVIGETVCANTPKLSPFYSVRDIFAGITMADVRRHSFRYAITAVLIFSLSFGGVSYAAESAIPGDVLYPVKTNVNESVMRVVAGYRGDMAREEVEVKILDRRMSEIEKVDEKKLKIVEEKVDEQIERLERKGKDMDIDDDKEKDKDKEKEIDNNSKEEIRAQNDGDEKDSRDNSNKDKKEELRDGRENKGKSREELKDKINKAKIDIKENSGKGKKSRN